MNATKVKETAIKVLCTLAFPVGAFIIMEVIALIATGGKQHLFNFSNNLSVINYLRTVCISCCTALALSFNLSSGRFDLSLGAQRLLGTIVGGLIAVNLGLGPVGIVICAGLCGLLSGFLVGFIFVTTRIPPMVLGVGMTMIYECLAFVISGGQGLNLNIPGLEMLSDGVLFMGAVVMLLVLFIMVLFTQTKFGYDMRSIRGSQQIAYNSGVKLFKNVAICYTLAGGAVALGGVFEAAYTMKMEAKMGMSSNSAVMANCFPMFLGNFIARWSNQAIGIVVATFTLQFVNTGLSILNLSPSLTQSINMGLFLTFLIIVANQNLFKNIKARKDRIAKANQELAAAAI